MSLTSLRLPGALVGAPAVALALALTSPAVAGTRPAPSDAAKAVIVTMRSPVRAAAYEGRPRALERALRRAARSALPGPIARTRQPVRRLWLVNAVALRARPAEIRRLARDPAVVKIEPDRRVRVVAARPLADDPAPPAPFASGDWGLAAIFAPAVWREYGIDGTGVTVGSIDSGMDASHPDLAGKLAAWHDFVNRRPTPYDDNGHGTHTIATMVGGSASGHPVGVAPGAHVVVAKALDAGGGTNTSTLLAAAQWLTDPDGDPATADAPTVINASWGGMGVDPDGALRRLILRWRELGIVPVFSAGNSGPDAASVVAPAAYPETLAVAAIEPDGGIAPFSSRGPAAEGELGPKALGSLAPPSLKPDISAPGASVRSVRAGGGYVSWSGTSMAAPHVAGVVALVRQAGPALTVSGVESLLRESATDIGPSGPDQMAGAGLVNALAAVRAIRGPAQSAPALRLIAVPPVLTNQAAPAFAVDTGGAPVVARVDDGPPMAPQPGPIVHVPVARAGRHTIELEALDGSGAPIGSPVRVPIEIDRTKPHMRLVVDDSRLLQIGYRVEGAGDVLRGSLRVRTSEHATLTAVKGRDLFVGPGPYWIELSARDRAGNVRRIRRALRWPRALVARRLAWNRAFLYLDYGLWLARVHRTGDGRFRQSAWLAQLVEGNLESGRFRPLSGPSARPLAGAVGVWSSGHSLVIVVERDGRRYLLEDHNGSVRRVSSRLPTRGPTRLPARRL